MSGQWVEPPPPQHHPQHPQQNQPPQYAPPPQPGYAPPGAAPSPGTFVCPKCRGEMRTFNRNNIHIEQCLSCRGIFLDFGELENLTQLEGQMAPQYAPPPGNHGYGPGWGNHGGRHYRKQGFGRLFFSS